MKSIKNYLISFGSGLLVTIVLAVFMLKVTMNFQIILIFGFTLFFIAGLLNSMAKINKPLNAILISFSFLTLFILLVLKEIPELYYFVPLFFLACLFGLYYKEYRKIIIVSGIVTVALLFFLAVKVIPVDLENSLTQTRSESMPAFSMVDMSGNELNSTDLKGKVIVLDFFGTWCKPCVQELVELDKIQNNFKDDKDVVFYIINVDVSGDTPEKFQAFIDKNNYNFNFVYDYKSKIYKQLGFQQISLPTLLLIDKSQYIRMQHVGYNPAETNFKESLINTITGLR